jgi:hypothetical protein
VSVQDMDKVGFLVSYFRIKRKVELITRVGKERVLQKTVGYILNDSTKGGGTSFYFFSPINSHVGQENEYIFKVIRSRAVA